MSIDHFTVSCLVAWPLNESEAGGDFVLIETSFSHVNDAVLMLISRNLHMKSSKVSIKTRSTPASLSFKGQATKQETVKWSIRKPTFRGIKLEGGRVNAISLPCWPGSIVKHMPKMCSTLEKNMTQENENEMIQNIYPGNPVIFFCQRCQPGFACVWSLSCDFQNFKQ